MSRPNYVVECVTKTGECPGNPRVFRHCEALALVHTIFKLARIDVRIVVHDSNTAESVFVDSPKLHSDWAGRALGLKGRQSSMKLLIAEVMQARGAKAFHIGDGMELMVCCADKMEHVCAACSTVYLSRFNCMRCEAAHDPNARRRRLVRAGGKDDRAMYDTAVVARAWDGMSTEERRTVAAPILEMPIHTPSANAQALRAVVKDETSGNGAHLLEILCRASEGTLCLEERVAIDVAEPTDLWDCTATIAYGLARTLRSWNADRVAAALVPTDADQDKRKRAWRVFSKLRARDRLTAEETAALDHACDTLFKTMPALTGSWADADD